MDRGVCTSVFLGTGVSGILGLADTAVGDGKCHEFQCSRVSRPPCGRLGHTLLPRVNLRDGVPGSLVPGLQSRRLPRVAHGLVFVGDKLNQDVTYPSLHNSLRRKRLHSWDRYHGPTDPRFPLEKLTKQSGPDYDPRRVQRHSPSLLDLRNPRSFKPFLFTRSHRLDASRVTQTRGVFQSTVSYVDRGRPLGHILRVSEGDTVCDSPLPYC